MKCHGKHTKTMGAACALMGLMLLVAHEVQAIPAFARKYQTSCMTCHESFPRLSAQGEAFRLNGYKFADDEDLTEIEPVEMGDEAYKRVFPRAVWPSTIPGMPPIALRMTSDLNYDMGGSQEARTDFVLPAEAKLLGAGAFGEHLSFFAELEFKQGGGGHGGHGGGGDAGGDQGGTEVEIAGWIQFEDLLGPENMLNLQIGTVGMQEMGLFTARDHNRFTISPYLYSMSTLPDIEHMGEEHEGNPFMMHAQPGVELHGFGSRWRYALGVVNGNGSVKDNNSQKDVFVQLAYKFGGMGFDGTGAQASAEEEDGGGSAAAEPWRDDSVILSLFAYTGTATVGHMGEESEDDFWRVGPGALWRWKDLQLGAGLMFGHHDDGYAVGEEVETQSYFLEANYFVYPWLVPTFRYEALHLDLPENDEQDQSRIVIGAKALIRANVSAGLEGRFYLKDDTAEHDDDNDLVVVRFDVAF